MSADVHAQVRDLVRACVQEETASIQRKSAKSASQSGGVTCPSGDIVGFPPRARKHNRDDRITIHAGNGRMICPGTVPSLSDVSDNGGGHDNYEFSQDRSSVSVKIYCRGASPGNGRRWFNATLNARTCLRITEEILLDVTLTCAERLSER